jgi:lysophospholipase L1-like esterase
MVAPQAGDHLIKAPARWPKLILFGDSHFQHGFSQEAGIASLLADQLQRRVDVVVRGFAGYNTRFAKIILDHVFDEFKNIDDIAGVLLLFGSNDAAVKTDDPLCQHTPLKDFSKNIKEIVERLIERGIPKEKIVLISPPPVVANQWDAHCVAEKKPYSPRDNFQSARYSQEMEEVAESHQTSFADLHHHLINANNWEEFFADGLHLNRQGSLVFLETLQHNLDQILKEHPMIYPDWKVVDHQNPAVSLV